MPACPRVEGTAEAVSVTLGQARRATEQTNALLQLRTEEWRGSALDRALIHVLLQKCRRASQAPDLRRQFRGQLVNLWRTECRFFLLST